VHSDRCSVVLSPWRGGAVEDLTLFGSGVNFANVLTRRLEAYHITAVQQAAESDGGNGGAASIHEIEEGLRLAEPPPVDSEDRAIFVDRVLPGDLALDAYARSAYTPLRSWARTAAHFQIADSPSGVEIRLSFHADGAPLRKTVRVAADGRVGVDYEWTPAPDAESTVFATELSLFRPLALTCDPEPELWRFPVETIAKSERGLDHTRQGESVTPRWPLGLGRARIELGPPEA
jgi:hypothetical protein